jgi:hypothetical protein
MDYFERILNGFTSTHIKFGYAPKNQIPELTATCSKSVSGASGSTFRTCTITSQEPWAIVFKSKLVLCGSQVRDFFSPVIANRNFEIYIQIKARGAFYAALIGNLALFVASGRILHNMQSRQRKGSSSWRYFQIRQKKLVLPRSNLFTKPFALYEDIRNLIIPNWFSWLYLDRG